MVADQPEIANRLRIAFPRRALPAIIAALRVMPSDQHGPSEHDIGPVVIRGEALHIPHRIYSAEPFRADIAELSELSQLALCCLYTRHHDGHVREKFLGEIIGASENWVPPFVLQLVGEYVVEILEVVALNVEQLETESYSRFCEENPAFLALLKGRVVSYWNCYYRWEIPFKEYPGFKILKKLNLWTEREMSSRWMNLRWAR